MYLYFFTIIEKTLLGFEILENFDPIIIFLLLAALFYLILPHLNIPKYLLYFVSETV